MIDKIKKAFEDAFGIEKTAFSLDLSPDEITEWDSLGHLRLISALEEQFSIKFEIEEIMEMESVNKIIEIVSKREIP